MVRRDLISECNNLEQTIDNLMNGKEVCRINDKQHSLYEVIEFLQDYLQELKDLNGELLAQGNTPELLEKVHDKYTELWLFQASYTINSLPVVIGGLMKYPD